MTKKPIWVVAVVVACGTGIALTRANTPDSVRERPVAIPANKALTPDVAAVFRRACVDCHSNTTRWPWYANVPPASWLVRRDVERGKQKLNFSEWTVKQKISPNEMQEICDAVDGGSMPPAAYTLVHWDARLSADDVKTICQWPARVNRAQRKASLAAVRRR